MSENSSILHELYVYSEWKPEPEYLQKHDNILPESLSALWHWVKFFGAKKSLIDSVNAYKKKLQKWQIALGDEGKVIAVVTDNILEIRTKRSEYATIAARTTVARDPYSQWRKVVWSPDCSFIVLAHGNGIVSFFDLTASNLFNIPFECSRPGGLECTDTTHAVAAIIFMPLRVKDPKWNWEVLIVSFDGLLRAFLVSQTDGFKLHNSFRFAGGVGAVTYCHPHNTLYVAGVPHRSVKDPQSPLTAGLTAWRTLNDEPYYKLSVVSDELESQLVNNAYQFYIPFLSSKNADFVIRMEISPDNSRLVCLHCSGDVSLWQLPRLRLQRRYRLQEQPAYNYRNPLLPDAPDKDPSIFSPIDVDWWSDKEIILSRHYGAVTICRTEDLVNILGQQPEFMQGSPQITRAYDGTFMALECESNVLPAKRSRSDESMEVVPAEEDVEQETSAMDVCRELAKWVLFTITDLEAFQPRPRRVTVVARVYRLLAVRSTTPDELFARQIDSGRYPEALALAATYGLDSDLVYQQQWRKNPVSTDAIQQYLSKVAKKIWAVHQCVDRLPESLTAARELLQFGLRLTNEKILEEINKDKDDEEAHKSLEEVTAEDLNTYTSELLRCRHVMLFYRQRMALYEAILRAEKSSYTKDEYHRLRSNNLVYSASEIAKEGRIEALTCLWPNLKTTYMQLTVLDNLPETIDPLKYQHLLPTLQPNTWFEKKSPIKVKPTEDEHDWCKKEIFRSIWSSNWSEDTTPDGYGSYTGFGVTDSETVAWYTMRARAIERCSGLVSHALTLLRLGEAGGVPLHHLSFHLGTLDTLVYDINLEHVTLEWLEGLTADATCRLLMSKSTPATFVSDMKQYVLPYLRRYEEYTDYSEMCNDKLADYLADHSVHDLTYILLFVQAKDEFNINMEDLLDLVEKCLLSYAETEQLDLACELLNTMLKESSGSFLASEAVRRVAALERLVAGSSRLAWRGVCLPLATLREQAENKNQAANLLTALAMTMRIRKEKPTQSDWESLLKDILELQSIILDRVSISRCYEIYALALMTSGDASTIRLAREMLTRVDGAQAERLVLSAAQEYANSASSLTDPVLELARCCLDLIEDGSTKIEEEIDLIASMKILHSFNLEMIPVQVRLCTERLELVEQCLASEPGAYLASHKLLKLAKLLRVGDYDDQLREGQVLQLVCAAALEAGAAGEAASAAARLAELRYAPAAPLLARVAEQPAPADTATRLSLLAASLSNCKPDCIEDYLNIRLRLRIEGMQTAGRGRAQRWPSTEEEFCDAITTPVIENKDLVAPADQEKKMPLFYLLLDSFQSKFSPSDNKSAGGETAEREVHCQEFYQSLYPSHCVSDAYYRYSRFALPDDRDGHAALLNWYYTQNCLDDSMNELEAEVTSRCGNGWVYADTALSVACMALSVACMSNAARGVTPLPSASSAPSPHAPPVAAALYGTLLRCAVAELKDNVYLTPPKLICELVLIKQLASPEQLDQIREFLARLSDTGDVLRLRKLGLPVSAPLFHADQDYRLQLVYRLARSESPEQYSLAMRLARKHGLDEVDVWLQHAAARLAPIELPDAVKTPEAYPRVRDTLWAGLAGNDHGALIAYFSILRSIDEKPLVLGLTAAEHVKLLKKAKAASPELDYKLLLEQPGSEALSQHVLAIIRPETVGLLTKFLRTLPAALRAPVPVNQIYTDWLTKYFFSVGNTGGGPSSKKWMQQYRQCASYFNKLAKEDLLRFLENVCFTADALARVPSGTRSLMLMQAVDYCQQEQENDFKFNKNEQSWAAVGQELTRWARFLENYHSEAVRAIRDAADIPHDQIWPSLEMSHGDVQRVESACAELALRGLRAGALASLLQCLHVPRTPRELLEHALDNQLQNVQDMQTFATRLTQYHKEGVELGEALVERALERARALELAPHLQLPLLALGGRRAPHDLHQVARSTVDLFRNQWPEHADDIDEEMLSSEEGRSRVFEQFVERCDSWPRSKALADALGCWPHTTTRWSHSAICEYLRRQLRPAPDALLLIRLLLRRPALPYEEVKWLAEAAEECAVVNALWIILLSKCEHADELVCSLVQRHKEGVLKQKIEDDMIKELLDQNMFTKLVATPLYSSIINYIMSADPTGPFTVPWAAAELLKANCIAEAGHLQLLSIGVPSSLRGFTQIVLHNK